MNNDSKTSPLGICFLSTFLYRSFYIIGLFNLIISLSKTDSVFSIIIGGLIGIIFILSYFYLNNHLPNNNIFDKINLSFPRAISSLLNVILIICFLFISSFSLYNISLFINYNLLNDINIIPICLLLLVCTTYLACKGINTIVRTSGLLIFIFIFLTIISIIALINYSNPTNLYPILITNPKDILQSSLSYLIYSLTPLFMLLIIPKEKIENNHLFNKYMLTSYIINTLYFLINLILILSILGYKFTSILNYPDIIVLQKVSLLNFIERIEDLLSFKLIFDSFIFISLSTLYIKEGLTSCFKIKKGNNYLIYIISIITIVLSLYLRITDINKIMPFFLAILVVHFILLIFVKKINNFTKSSQ